LAKHIDDDDAAEETPAGRQGGAPPHTWRIEFLGVGEDEVGERFLKVKVRDKAALLKVDGLRGANPAELTILTRLGEPLLTQPAIKEFIGRAQEQAREDPSFEVATKIGLRDDVFVLPDGLCPRAARRSNCISIRDTRCFTRNCVAPGHGRAGKRWSSGAAERLGQSPASP